MLRHSRQSRVGMAKQTKKGRTLGPRVSARQFEILWDHLSANPALVRAATDSPPTRDERKVLWDVVASDLNAQGPAVKTRAEWKGYWNSRVYAARGRDRNATTSARQTGGVPTKCRRSAPKKKKCWPSWEQIPHEGAVEGARDATRPPRLRVPRLQRRRVPAHGMLPHPACGI